MGKISHGRRNTGPVQEALMTNTHGQNDDLLPSPRALCGNLGNLAAIAERRVRVTLPKDLRANWRSPSIKYSFWS
jgi:hypothetical protein